jgi:hypothetical protein
MKILNDIACNQHPFEFPCGLEVYCHFFGIKILADFNQKFSKISQIYT